MSKKPITVRLDAEVLDRLDSYAATNGMSRTEAVEAALAGLLSTEGAEDTHDGPEAHKDPDGAVLEALMAANADLRAALVDTRAVVATLTAQMSVKDEQIARAHELIDQAHRLQMAEVQRALPPARAGILERLRRMTERGS